MIIRPDEIIYWASARYSAHKWGCHVIPKPSLHCFEPKIIFQPSEEGFSNKSDFEKNRRLRKFLQIIKNCIFEKCHHFRLKHRFQSIILFNSYIGFQNALIIEIRLLSTVAMIFSVFISEISSNFGTKKKLSEMKNNRSRLHRHW